MVNFYTVQQLPSKPKALKGYIHLPSENSHSKKLCSNLSSVVKFALGPICHQIYCINFFKERNIHCGLRKSVWIMLLGTDYTACPWTGKHLSDSQMAKLRLKRLLTWKWPFWCSTKENLINLVLNIFVRGKAFNGACFNSLIFNPAWAFQNFNCKL